jgi:HAMP domain-containing protein
MGHRVSSAYLRSFAIPKLGLAKVRLRTKFLLSLTIVIAALTFATLAVVRHAAEELVRESVEQDARNSVLTFQNLRAERQFELERSAELLATLPELKAMMADDQVSSIQDASEPMWRSGETELFALANWTGKIVALHTLVPGFPREAAETALAHSAGSNGTGAWWFSDGHLYQVAVRPIQLGGPSSQMYLGTVIVGREIDSRVASEVARIALCQVAFRYGDEAVVSSLSTLDGAMAASALKSAANKNRIELGDKSYLVSTVNLTAESSPPLTLTVLKPYDDAMAFLTRLNHTLGTLGFLAVFAGGALVFLLSRTFTQPLESLVHGVRALESGNYDYPLGRGSGDEVSEVTAAFERMRGTLQTNAEQRASLENQLRQAQKWRR